MRITCRRPETARTAETGALQRPWPRLRGTLNQMLRLSAIFIAVCMMLIAGSIGVVLYFGAGLDMRTAAIIALGALIVMALYNSITNRLRDRGVLGDQIADLSRGTADLSRQMAEMSRRLAAVEGRVEQTVNRARGAVDPI